MRASIILLFAFTLAQAANKNAEPLTDATAVLTEVMATPDKAIPKELLNKAHRIAVAPGLKKGALRVRKELN